jgi:hypothetical protein
MFVREFRGPDAIIEHDERGLSSDPRVSIRVAPPRYSTTGGVMHTA